MSNPDQPTIPVKGLTADSRKKKTGSAPSDEPTPQMPGLPDPNTDIHADSIFETPDIDILLEELNRRTPAVEGSTSGAIPGTIVDVRDDGFFVDIGRKSEAFLSREDAFDRGNETTLSVGKKVTVSVTGRSPDGYLKISRVIAERPKNWSQLEDAFAKGLAIIGTVSEVIKGGLAVDVGVRAFLPKSRSGVRETSDLEKLVGEEIFCRISQVDGEDENVI